MSNGLSPSSTFAGADGANGAGLMVESSSRRLRSAWTLVRSRLCLHRTLAGLITSSADMRGRMREPSVASYASAYELGKYVA